MMLAELDALSALLGMRRAFSHVINLSATAFPIKTRLQIQEVLRCAWMLSIYYSRHLHGSNQTPAGYPLID